MSVLTCSLLADVGADLFSVDVGVHLFSMMSVLICSPLADVKVDFFCVC